MIVTDMHYGAETISKGLRSKFCFILTTLPTLETLVGNMRNLSLYMIFLLISSLYVCMVIFKLKYNFVETPRKFIIAKLSIPKLGSSSVLIIMSNALLLALMKIRAYGSKALR